MTGFKWPALRRPALLIGLAAFAGAGTAISPALGGPGLLTNQEAKKFFYTKKRAKKVFYTKRKVRKSFYTKAGAEGRFLDSSEAATRFLDPGEASSRFLRPSDADARYLTPAQGDSRYVQPSGETRIAVGTAGWLYTPASSDFSMQRDSSTLIVRRVSSPGPDYPNQVLTLAPTLPSQIYGVPMRLSGVEVCYDNAQTTLVQAEVVQMAATAADPISSIVHLVQDTTPRSDITCRLYAPSTPAPLEESMVGVDLTVDFDTGISPSFVLTRTSFLLVP